MKDILEILKDNGIEVPEENQKELRRSLNENYIAINEHTKKLDKANEQISSANETISDLKPNMISERELLAEIDKYERNLTNYQCCEKLANLYIIYDHLYGNQESTQLQPNTKTIETESIMDSSTNGDILPAYFSYIEVKKAYQYGDIPKEKVLRALDSLSREIKDFVKILYRNTDMPEEREKLNLLISEINVGNL